MTTNKRQPNSHYCVVHGGIIAAILDEAVGRVSMIDNLDHFMMTAKMERCIRKPSLYVDYP